MRVNELSRARGLLDLSRAGVSRVAFIGSAGYQNSAGTPEEFSFHPQTAPDETVRVKRYDISEMRLVGGGQNIEGYSGLRVTDTSSHTLDNPTKPHQVYTVDVDVKDGHNCGATRLITVRSNGDAQFYEKIVNGVPSGRQPEMSREQELFDLRQRTARGLLIARFTKAALEQVHDIPHIPTDLLDEAEEKLKAIVPYEELVAGTEYAVFIPRVFATR
jgi:hypothetical protein